jgi:hypothetical protein
MHEFWNLVGLWREKIKNKNNFFFLKKKEGEDGA